MGAHNRALVFFAAAFAVLACTLVVALGYRGQDRTNELLSLVRVKVVPMNMLCDSSPCPVPGPYDYFTTPDDYDGVPYNVYPTRAYDAQTMQDMIYLGQTGQAGIPLGYKGPKYP